MTTPEPHQLISLAQAVFGDEHLAYQWMNEPVPALGDQKPADLMNTAEGRQWVLSVLQKI